MGSTPLLRRCVWLTDQTRRHVARASICGTGALEPIWYRDGGPPNRRLRKTVFIAGFFELCESLVTVPRSGEEIPQTRNRLKRVFGSLRTRRFDCRSVDRDAGRSPVVVQSDHCRRASNRRLCRRTQPAFESLWPERWPTVRRFTLMRWVAGAAGLAAWNGSIPPATTATATRRVDRSRPPYA